MGSDEDDNDDFDEDNSGYDDDDWYNYINKLSGKNENSSS